MADDQTSPLHNEPVDLAVATRRQADELLRALVRERAVSEERFRESGQSDPVKDITGTSALDRAVDRTRQMIREMDGLISHLKPGTEISVNGESGETRVNTPGERVEAVTP
jgi:hypothetical protein